MRLKAVVLALTLGAVTAAGAAAEGGPGPGGGHPGPPPGGKPSGPPHPGETETGDHPGASAEHAFREQLTALGYTCMRRPVAARGSLTAIGAGSLTLHRLHAVEHGRPAATTDLTVKVLSTTQVRRRGPATVASLVVGDMVELLAVACRTAGAVAGTPPTVVARLIIAHPAHP